LGDWKGSGRSRRDALSGLGEKPREGNSVASARSGASAPRVGEQFRVGLVLEIAACKQLSEQQEGIRVITAVCPIRGEVVREVRQSRMRMPVMIKDQVCLALRQRVILCRYADGKKVVVNLAQTLWQAVSLCNTQCELVALTGTGIVAPLEAQRPETHHRTSLRVPIAFSRSGGMGYVKPGLRLLWKPVGSEVPGSEPREPGIVRHGGSETRVRQSRSNVIEAERPLSNHQSRKSHPAEIRLRLGHLREEHHQAGARILGLGPRAEIGLLDDLERERLQIINMEKSGPELIVGRQPQPDHAVRLKNEYLGRVTAQIIQDVGSWNLWPS
jgi:hypothetical protein